MNTPVPVEMNLNNLRYVFTRIFHLEAFIFFGTLLGYQREGNIIENDDDIDIYINARHTADLLDALSTSDFEITIIPCKRWYQRWRKPLFIQAMRVQDGIETFVDFYLYNDEASDHLEEKWNFLGQWKDIESAIHVPKSIIYPLVNAEMKGVKIRVPAQSEAVCSFLYGPGWKTPVLKSEGYFMEVIDNKPVFREKGN